MGSNTERLRAGQIVYYVTLDNRNVDWGICKDFYADGYGLELYEMPDFRTICGVPIRDFEFNQPRRKLPKDWRWETDLVHIGSSMNEEVKQKYLELRIDNPQALLDAVRSGLLVKPSSQSTACDIEADINKDGYTIVQKFPYWKRSRPDTACVRSDRCFHTYAEAAAIVDCYYAELKRQAELSDYDWSVEQIDHVLERWKAIYGVSPDGISAIRQWLLGQKDVADLVVRIYGGELQFKYDRQKRWTTLGVV